MSISRLIVFLLASALAVPASALSPRVFVSPAGMDVGTCPITAPCRTFAYAITQVAPAGEIIALSTAGYGPVTITQSVAIIAAPGATAFIAASSGNAITINAAPSDIVTLRGLALTSTGGATGIDFPAGHSLNVENCIVNGFSTYGISMTRFGDIAPQITMLNSVIRNNHDAGLIVLDYGPGSAGGGPPPNLGYATVSKSFFTGNFLVGIHAADNARIAVSDTVLAGNGNFAVYASENSDFSSSEVNLERCTIARNTFGVHAGYPVGQPPHGLIRIANCLITNNDAGLSTTATGAILVRVSNGVMTNTIEGNNTNGSPTGNYSAQ